MTMTEQSAMPDSVYRNQESDFIEQDIIAYLQQHEEKELLRFITCGSVDDGKSTLIGRLLHDSKMIFEDQLAAITEDSKKSGTQGDNVDLALLVDGLQAEREQGITIDVAYRYFSTDKRKFIIADTPGHEQYTRNMATGGSTCDLAIILIDARKGVQTQTKRHSFICSLLGVKHVVVAINKMDLVEYAQETFETIKTDYLAMATSLHIPHIHCIPISALIGDNVVNPSKKLSWFQGDTLMSYLETVRIHEDSNNTSFRFPVQLVCRPNSNFRGFQGTVASGALAVGDAITVLPANTHSTIKSIETFEGSLEQVQAKEAVTLTLLDEVDVSRGDMIVKSAEDTPFVSTQLTAQIIWMHDDALDINKERSKEYRFKFASKTATGTVRALQYRVDINTFETHDADRLKLNEIGSADISLTEQVVFDTYHNNKQTGAFIIIDRLSNQTVGAGMVKDVLAEKNKKSIEVGELSDFEKELILLVRKYFG